MTRETPRYRDCLPQTADAVFLTDGGLETTLVFHEGLDLPHFAAFHLLREPSGRAVLDAYFRRHAGIARACETGFILESATWRASADWGERLGYSPGALADANRQAVAQLHRLRAELETDHAPMVISGCVGPRGDGYQPGSLMSPAQAEAYHAPQIRTLAEAGVDLVTAITMTNTHEALGITRAACAAGVPVVISFTVETDGRLPTGEPLDEAVSAVDRATQAAPAYFMINCAHPTHFEPALAPGAPWCERIRGLRANASRCSHAELDQAEELDCGDPRELGAQYRDLRRRMPWITVLGGCCGTDHRHVEAIAAACLAEGDTRELPEAVGS